MNGHGFLAQRRLDILLTVIGSSVQTIPEVDDETLSLAILLPPERALDAHGCLHFDGIHCARRPAHRAGKHDAVIGIGVGEIRRINAGGEINDAAFSLLAVSGDGKGFAAAVREVEQRGLHRRLEDAGTNHRAFETGLTIQHEVFQPRVGGEDGI